MPGAVAARSLPFTSTLCPRLLGCCDLRGESGEGETGFTENVMFCSLSILFNLGGHWRLLTRNIRNFPMHPPDEHGDETLLRHHISQKA